MNRLTEQDVQILRAYADDGNRELYWNYLASRPSSDGYGLLALGVVRNDNVAGAVANAFADAAAKRAGVNFSERRWNEFGVDLMERDFKARERLFNAGQSDLAMNLPAREVMRVHDEAFRDARIPVNAWTPREYLQAAREQGQKDAGPRATPQQREAAGNAEMERGWTMMMDNRGMGLARGAETARNIVGRYRDELPDFDGYLARLASARALAAVSASNDNPDRIGASSVYHERGRDGRWTLVNDGPVAGPAFLSPGERRSEHLVRDPATIRELEDTRQLRMEIRDKRDDFHPLDPARSEGIRRSPRTLAEAESVDGPATTRLATRMDEPGHPDHALYLGARAGVERMEAGLGRGFDASSEALTRSAVVLARQNGMERVDHVLLSIDNGRDVRAGQNLFVVQGAVDDPAHRRACMRTDDALARSPAQCESLLVESRVQQQGREQAEAHEHQTTIQRDGARGLG